MDLSSVTFREEVLEKDPENVRNIVTSTGFFHEEEIDIAVELPEERLAKGLKSGYLFVFAEVDNIVAGYTCYGIIPCTKASYDLYWIAVHNDFRGSGIGKMLLSLTEKKIKELGGHGVYIETSTRKQYEPTRAFYLRCDYKEAAVLENFYDINDGKVIYVKSLLD